MCAVGARGVCAGAESGLGRNRANFYGEFVIRLLRFVGVTNAAVWFGAAVFYTLCAAPAMISPEMESLLQPKNFPFFSGAVGQILLGRYFQFHFVCAAIALAHLLAEKLYLSRSPKRYWTGLLVVLFWFSVVGSFWLGPKLRDLQRGQFLVNATPAQREAAAKSFRVWHGVFQAVNVLLLGGVAVVLWRAANPSDELRFVGSAKFRG
ncbi:MAG: DUF4149 domain-containing protein [Pedosphaera sp.]|nr:DUF4149 domain-containing protein [Pedosphaera sp.]